METAEQAALSESERDSAHHHHQAQSQMSHRLYEARHLNDYISDDAKDLLPKPMRRFEKLVVNLTHSSVLVPAGISLSGMPIEIPKYQITPTQTQRIGVPILFQMNYSFTLYFLVQTPTYNRRLHGQRI